jgi:hypothetical protein
LILVEEYVSKREAMEREKVLKSGKGREFLRKEILTLFKQRFGLVSAKADRQRSAKPCLTAGAFQLHSA